MSEFDLENFYASYERNQKIMKDIVLQLMAAKELGVKVLAEKTGIDEIKLKGFEEGEGKITLIEFAQILSVLGAFEKRY